jgi:ferredoxin-NADP reductase/(2Fe-2S) ferredoxin
VLAIFKGIHPTMTDHFYEAHLFCCINERDADHPRGSCARRGSVELHKHMKARAKELGIKGIRVNKAGCLDRCELGPVMVIYPEGTWYGINSTDDIDAILQNHLLNGEPVERLKLSKDQKLPNPLPGGDLQVKVQHTEKLTDDIKLFELVSLDGNDLPAFEAGAHIDIKINDQIRRSYSLTNDPAEHSKYVISVLDEPDGRGGSHWLHTNLATGDQITVVAPENNFQLAEDAGEHLFIAGGIGISPILSMGRHLKNRGARMSLHYCTKTPAQTAFIETARDIFGAGLTFHHDGGDPAKGIDLETTLRTRPEGAHVYICGPKGMIDAALKCAAHWPQESVHYELFSGTETALKDDDGAFTVVLKKSGVTLEVLPGNSILDTIRKAGIMAESSCESGICATCQTDLLDGEADHRDEVLSPAEQDAQTSIIICMSRAKPGETLVLDL